MGQKPSGLRRFWICAEKEKGENEKRQRTLFSLLASGKRPGFVDSLATPVVERRPVALELERHKD